MIYIVLFADGVGDGWYHFAASTLEKAEEYMRSELAQHRVSSANPEEAEWFVVGVELDHDGEWEVRQYDLDGTPYGGEPWIVTDILLNNINFPGV